MINSIQFLGKELDGVSNLDSPKLLLNLKKVNIFLGANNTGKSRYLRFLFIHEDIYFFKDEDVDEIKLDSLSSKFYRNYLQSIISNHIELSIDQLKTFKELREYESISGLLKLFNFLRGLELKVHNSIYKREYESFNDNLVNFEYNFQSDLFTFSDRKTQRLYIPILRGLRDLKERTSDIDKDLYYERTSLDYFKNSKRLEIFTGLSIYKDVTKLLLGEESDRELIRGFERLLEAKIFQDKVTLIPKYNQDVLNVKIGNESQMPIYDLGDGIQSVILILFSVFTRNTGTWITMIEEPEQHLHPKWQKLLLEALKEIPNHTFFITSHSASFIDSKEVDVYNFYRKKEETYFKKVIDNEEQRLKLLELGYSASDIFQTNFVLWVEGPSDKVYWEYFIFKMDPNLEIDNHYTIFSIGGDNFKRAFKIEEGLDFSTIKSINQNFGLVLDSDRKDSDSVLSVYKELLIKKFDEDNSFCWITEYREIENYIEIEEFKTALKKVHQVKDVKLESGDYVDRGYFDQDKVSSLKSNIKLPENIFSLVQKSDENAINSIPAKELKQAIINSLRKTKHSRSKVKKVEVAKELVSNGLDVINPQLSSKIQQLISKIKEVNGL